MPPEARQCDMRDIVLGPLLGKGSFGHVHVCHIHECAYALKCVDLTGLDARDVAKLQCEQRALLRFRHPHLLRGCEHVVIDRGAVCFTMELFSTTLARVLRRHFASLCDADRVRILGSVLDALVYMHAGGMLHCDVKPDNILLTTDRVVLGDFGMLGNAEASGSSYVVTRWYRAPELLWQAPFDDGIDVWAWGCTWAESFLRQGLFPGNDVPHQRKLLSAAFEVETHAPTYEAWLAQCQPLQLPPIPEAARPVLLAALQPDRRRRPSALALLGLLKRKPSALPRGNLRIF